MLHETHETSASQWICRALARDIRKANSYQSLATRPREAYRGFWLMLGLWGILDGVIVWPSLLQEPMTLSDMRVVLGINLLLQCIYLPTGIIMATRAKPLVKGFGFGILVSAISLGIIDAIFYLRASGQ